MRYIRGPGERWEVFPSTSLINYDTAQLLLVIFVATGVASSLSMAKWRNGIMKVDEGGESHFLCRTGDVKDFFPWIFKEPNELKSRIGPQLNPSSRRCEKKSHCRAQQESFLSYVKVPEAHEWPISPRGLSSPFLLTVAPLISLLCSTRRGQSFSGVVWGGGWE